MRGEGQACLPAALTREKGGRWCGMGKKRAKIDFNQSSKSSFGLDVFNFVRDREDPKRSCSLSLSTSYLRVLEIETIHTGLGEDEPAYAPERQSPASRDTGSGTRKKQTHLFFFFLSGAVTAESLNSAQGHLDEPELVQRRVIRMGLKSRWE